MADVAELVAPTTLPALRQLLEQITQGQVALRLGAQARRVLTAMVEQPQRAAVSTISQLATELGVNASTLSRLAQRLGYSGFNDLQAVFRRELTEGSHFYSEQASRLQMGGSEVDGLSQFTRLARQESANLATLVGSIDATQLEASTHLLVKARKVRVHGVRQLTSIALFMSYGLGLIRDEVALLDPAQQGVAQGLAPLNEDDVLVVVSCFPYSSAVLKTAEVARSQGIPLIALTDSASSPLARLTPHVFQVPTHSLFYSNSMCGFMLLAEGLLAEVAHILGDQGVETLQRREALITALQERI
ncbi:MurR/RpiR family transcriptional regulator [Pokkaliibacter sp. MBI-7]|uniref:MurR/RpiR family transcriptional regulator n=1 Tax=Pokkaliibacter sp. MBI-7 TaxID=3040600 RepID=UPI00244A6844|nr:MurR/RpiR family transcriptional regulator [Pokkaliibacter sp. MBI-7]MDH2433221.1 MurR/RpiR family transcriptional regulator [Pokkaliibacter sp. MBI-7]